jgi:beta-glucanase (GH16 family)
LDLLHHPIVRVDDLRAQLQVYTMKLCLITSLFLSAATCVVVVVTAGVVAPDNVKLPSSSTTIVWSDEFNATTTVDAAWWNVRTNADDGAANGWGSGQLQVYTASNVGIVNGEHLQIVVTEENLGFGTEDTDGGTLFSARLDTKDKVHMLYGTLSVRMKLVHSSATVVGMNPSIWTMGSNNNADNAGQVFVANVGPGVSAASMQPRVVSSVTWSTNTPTTNATTTMEGSTRTTTFTASGWLGCDHDDHDWAIYTLDWTPTSIATYRNNDLVFYMPIDEASCGDCRFFHQPQYIGVNVAVGGGFASPPYGDSSRLQCAADGNYDECGTLLTATDIVLPTSPLAVLQVDWIRIFDNGHCQVVVTPPSTTTTTTTAAPAVVNENGSPPPPPPPVPTPFAPVVVSTPAVATAPMVMFPVALATTEPAPSLPTIPFAVSVPPPRDSSPVRPSVRRNKDDRTICARVSNIRVDAHVLSVVLLFSRLPFHPFRANRLLRPPRSES